MSEKPFPQKRNANRHTQRGMQALETSLAQDGWIGAITVAADGETFDGSARVEKTAENGMLDDAIVVDSDGTRPIVVRRTDIATANDPRAKRLSIAANRVASLNLEWEPDVLAELAGELDLSSMFSAGELADLAAPVEAGAGGDEFDTTPDDGPTRTNVGELWSIGGVHRLIVGDCTDPAVVARLMGGERAKLCFTSPPYSDQREYDRDSDLLPAHLALFMSVSADVCDLYAINLGVSRKNNEIQLYWDEYISAARGANLKLLSWNVWDQGSVGSVGKITAMFPIEHEFIFVFGERRIGLHLTVPNKDAGRIDRHVSDRQSDGSTIRKGAIEIRSHRPIGTVARITPQLARNLDTSHPAMFPIELPSTYIEACTEPDDVTYDPFLGSGTTLIAAHRTGRRCYGCEIAPRYADVILRRAEAEGLTVELLDTLETK